MKYNKYFSVFFSSNCCS